MGISRSEEGQNAISLTAREIPPSLAPLLAELELDQPRIVAVGDIAALGKRLGLAASARDLTDRLQKHGWLLPLRTRGMYEFVPAARAGRCPSGDPFIELRATLRRRPDLPIQVAGESAAWLHGYATREPNQHVISAPQGLEVPAALDEFRVVRYTPQSTPAAVDGLPVWSPEALLVAMAARPTLYRDWPNVLDWLGQAVSRLADVALRRELDAHPNGVTARLAYILNRGGHHNQALELIERVGHPRGPVYLGSDRRAGTYDKTFGVVDSLLHTRPGLKL
jgi:hypothetical protein